MSKAPLYSTAQLSAWRFAPCNGVTLEMAEFGSGEPRAELVLVRTQTVHQLQPVWRAAAGTGMVIKIFYVQSHGSICRWE